LSARFGQKEQEVERGIRSMAATQSSTRFTREVASFLASGPSPEELLRFRPSDQAQHRARELLQKQSDGRITSEEQWELDEFEYAEMLMQLVKATIRAGKVSQP
jgi:hypothetical protein